MKLYINFLGNFEVTDGQKPLLEEYSKNTYYIDFTNTL